MIMKTNGGHPLGLPQGSVRAIITLMLTACLPVLAIMWARGNEAVEAPFAAIGAITTLTIGHYFGARPDKKAEG